MTEPITHKSLVLVLGAGASCTMGFPLGITLRDQIANALRFSGSLQNWKSGDALIFESLRRIDHARNDLTHSELARLVATASQIERAMPLETSIDSYIDNHSDNPRIATCAKLAIARLILAAESKSSLHVDERKAHSTIAFDKHQSVKCWYASLFGRLKERCAAADVAARLSKVGIISFNYDRSLEHYLHRALQRYYNGTPEWAAEVLKSLDIHHPYGRVGSLPWMDEPHPIAFGDEPNPPQLVTLSEQLLTFSEGTRAEKDLIASIRQMMRGAARIVFLGFGFHSLNMELLFGGSPERGSHRAEKIIGTVFEVSKPNAKSYRQDISNRAVISEELIVLEGSECAPFFTEYESHLSLV